MTHWHRLKGRGSHKLRRATTHGKATVTSDKVLTFSTPEGRNLRLTGFPSIAEACAYADQLLDGYRTFEEAWQPRITVLTETQRRIVMSMMGLKDKGV